MKRIFIVLALGSLLGCEEIPSREEENIRAADQERASLDPYCKALLFRDGALTTIMEKAPLWGDATFDMLTNEQRVTEEERPVIREWANRELLCQRSNSVYLKKYVSNMHVSLYNSYVDNLNILRSQLHNGQITFGQFARERQKPKRENEYAFASLDDRTNQLAQQNAQQAYQNFILYKQTRLQEEQNFILEKNRHGTVTCNRIGAYTYCNY